MRALVIRELPDISIYTVLSGSISGGLFLSENLKIGVRIEDVVLEGARWQVVKAAEDGKETEVWEEAFGKWCPKETMTFFADSFYRIAPEPPKPQYVPFTANDWEMFTGKPVKWANDSVYRLIVEFRSDELMFDEDRLSYEYALGNLTFMDGSPFGKIVL